MTLNCSIVYGRLGVHYPNEAAKCLKECLKKVCYGFIMSQSEEQSKHDSFVGLNRIILCNPGDFLPNVAFYLEAIGLYQNPSADVVQGTSLILNELLKGDDAIKKQLSDAFTGLSSKAIAGLKAKFNFPPN